jgi:hypothetical protein
MDIKFLGPSFPSTFPRDIVVPLPSRIQDYKESHTQSKASLVLVPIDETGFVFLL